MYFSNKFIFLVSRSLFLQQQTSAYYALSEQLKCLSLQYHFLWQKWQHRHPNMNLPRLLNCYARVRVNSIAANYLNRPSRPSLYLDLLQRCLSGIYIGDVFCENVCDLASLASSSLFDLAPTKVVSILAAIASLNCYLAYSTNLAKGRPTQ
jgi:hypothetical protein